ncbi:lipocalin family protein [Gramella sp. GC03-9]|uniref:Lipocalin family protein n=1 Tax=Christiangramia oceanisediminis TaxID=2920386 RepID=A0A9X2RCV1_9FLAO|nr:lipocalin family protein [Gramella oceanisediminis]MCP9201025.1 lipocalin family protein [Gramella oceanisediminis]
MKKLLILFLSLSLFTACSDDDDATTDDGMEIVGKWYLIDVRTSATQNTLTDCNQNSFIQFNADNTASSEFYENVEGGGCELDGDNDGVWAYLGNSRYQFFIPELGNQTGTVNFTGDSQFIFTSPELPGIEVVFEK